MKTPALANEEEIFQAASDLPADQCAAYLDAACAGRPEMRGRIERLLSSHGANRFMQAPASAPPSAEIERELARLKPEEAGDRIDHYQLMEEIGRGGFGVVWVAEQEKPVRRRVALKIIKLGMDTKEVIGRFEQERQALAMMEHPNIAKVFEAGATQYGRPYFVMELVRGIKITEYCDQANLSTADRLHLFIAVCQAVQHAHQKGIIHRDLKPSNILVTLHDGVAVPKVIDFGVAKAMQQQRLTDLTVYTQFEQMIGTPLYMSPEQAEMSGLDIDTRSDVYSLGVLLYELLTGRTPFDPEALMRQGLDEIRRTIREREPQKPSTFVQTMAFERRTGVARHRQSDGAKLAGLIRGDLDWIVMKAIEKDRSRRYETANGLAADLQRHLSHEAVSARPPSRSYRLGKMVRRNKLAFGAASAVIIALVLGIVASTWQAIRATRAEREQSRLRDTAQRAEREQSRLRVQAEAEVAEARRVARFLGTLARSLRTEQNLTNSESAFRESLAMWARLPGNEEREADMLRSLAHVLQKQGKLDQAASTARAAASKYETALKQYLKPSADASGRQECWSFTIFYEDLGQLLQKLGQVQEAEKAYRDTQALWRKLVAEFFLEDDRFHLARSCDMLGTLLRQAGRPGESLGAYRDAQAIWLSLVAEFNEEDRRIHLGWTAENIGQLLKEARRFDEAAEAYRQALGVWKKLVVDLNKDDYRNHRSATLANCAASLRSAARHIEAERLYHEEESALREEIATLRKVLGTDHRDVAAELHSLAMVLRDQGKTPEAEISICEALAIRRKRLGHDHPAVAESLIVLFEVVVTQWKASELEALLQEQPAPGISAPESAQAQFGHQLWQLGNAYSRHEQFNDAERIYRKALQQFKQLQVQFPQNRFYRQEEAFSLRLLADAMQRNTRFAEAEASLRVAWDIYTQLAKEEPAATVYPEEAASTLQRLAEVLGAQGKVDEVEVMYREELVTAKKRFGEVHRVVGQMLVSLARVLQQSGKFAEAEAVWREELALERKLSGDDHPSVANSLYDLAGVLLDSGKTNDAEAVFRQALAMRRKLPSDGPQLAATLAGLTRTLLVQEKFAEAVPLARECLTIRENISSDDWLTFNARALLGGSLLGQKQFAEAEPLLLSAYEGMKQRQVKIPAIDKPRLKECLQRVVLFYQTTEQAEKVTEWNDKLAELDRAAPAESEEAPDKAATPPT